MILKTSLPLAANTSTSVGWLKDILVYQHRSCVSDSVLVCQFMLECLIFWGQVCTAKICLPWVFKGVTVTWMPIPRWLTIDILFSPSVAKRRADRRRRVSLAALGIVIINVWAKTGANHYNRIKRFAMLCNIRLAVKRQQPRKFNPVPFPANGYPL